MSSFRWSRLPLIWVLASLAALSACKSQKEKMVTEKHAIEGDWVIDLEALQRSQEFLAEPAEKREVILGIMTKMAASMTFRITNEQIIVGSEGKEQATPYRVEKKEKEEWVLTTFPKQGQPEENRVRFEGDGLILIGKNTEFALKRQNKAPK